MIPRIIHYCWFGGNPLPESARKCIRSWQKYFPDYELREWNESNYDVRKIPYIAQAYDAKRYAFVSDYARFDILYHEGGLYFDTDVQVIRSFDDILRQGAFMGFEIDGPEERMGVNPGLGIGAEPGMEVYGEILRYYREQTFLRPDGTPDLETVVLKTTRVLKRFGLRNVAGIQQVGGITVYPRTYFNPRDSITGKLELTPDTHSIHWYSMSWMPRGIRLRTAVTRVLHRILGKDSLKWLRRKPG